MTPGQMRQLFIKVASAIPANLTSEQANLLIRSRQLRNDLDAFWLKAVGHRVFEVVPPRDAWVAIQEHELQCDGSTGGLVTNDQQAAFIAELSLPHAEGVIELEEVVLLGDGGDGLAYSEIRRRLQNLGFRSADAREAVAFVLRYPEMVTHHTIVSSQRGVNNGLVVWFNPDEGTCKLEFRKDPKGDEALCSRVLAVKL